MNAPLIQARTLRGFRDYLPEAMIPRERLMEVARRVYRSYGFSPIDTPALEYEEILAGKGGAESDKLMYRFEDQGGRKVGLRFDLTVPLARFAAQHIGKLGTPLKRYHIAPVWRGENTQRGRYREFMQCDFDTIGTRSVVADIESALVIHDLFQALGFSDYSIRINNRLVLTGLLEKIGIADKATEILRALDKLSKIGRDKVAIEMSAAAGATDAQVHEVLKLAEISGTNDQVLKELKPVVVGSPPAEEGLARMADLIAGTRAAGVSDTHIQLDASIARGLDYYTGTVYETFLGTLPGIGSVCSGGRYDNLAKLYTNQELPGVGASLGLDRLLAAMEELDMIEKVTTPAAVFIPYFAKDRLHDYLRLGSKVRAAGFGVEIYPEPKKLGQQLKFADRRGFRVALIVGDDEFAAGTCQVKNLATSTSDQVPMDDQASAVIDAITKALNNDR